MTTGMGQSFQKVGSDSLMVGSYPEVVSVRLSADGSSSLTKVALVMFSCLISVSGTIRNL